MCCSDMLYKWLFDLFLKKHLLAICTFLNKPMVLLTAIIYILQTKNKQNLASTSRHWASLSPNLLMFINVLSLNSQFIG